MKKTQQPITAAQIKKIHALKSTLALDDDTYRAILYQTFRVDSSKKLTVDQAGRLIEAIEEKAVTAGTWEKQEPRRQKFNSLEGRSGSMATPPQLRKIEAMWQDVTRAEEPESRRKALRHFLERIAKVSALRFLDQDGAGKVINALQIMQKQVDITAKPQTRKKAV
jgi:phage gp16-like protein